MSPPRARRASAPGVAGPPAPDHLADQVRAAWSSVLAIAAAQGATLTDADTMLIEVAATQLARHRDAGERIAAEGEIVPGPRESPVPHPALGIERQAGRNLAEALRALGLTPEGVMARKRAEATRRR